jgi:uncharacterized protein (DUF608 family)
MKTDDTAHEAGMPRRKFLKISAATAGVLGAMGGGAARTGSASGAPARGADCGGRRRGQYGGEHLNQIAFPMGGIGAGMICLEGGGALSHVSLRNRPDLFNEPCVFAAVALKGAPGSARVLEGPVPARKIFGGAGSGNGDVGTTYGLPRFPAATFEARFPFATVSLSDPHYPLEVELTGWSPFVPGDADNSSLPAAALEYRFTNRSRTALEAVFSYNCKNFMALEDHAAAVRPIEGGFILWNGPSKEEPWDEGAFSATVSDPAVKVNYSWFRGVFWNAFSDAFTMAWKDVENAACRETPPVAGDDPSPGASLFVPFSLAPGESKTVVVRLAWYCGQTDFHIGKDPAGLSPAARATRYRPWYAGRFSDINSASYYWKEHYEELRRNSSRFRDCFYDTTLPPEVVEAAAANLTILKSPTVLRQTDGKLWGWEGCGDSDGCCDGSCTHVWNYAQALCHLFPELERSLRETEFGPSQDPAGRQTFRSGLPIRPVEPIFPPAADGQLGGIMKVFREWRISGDTGWLRALWPRVKHSLDYCIEAWDPRHDGMVEEPHHNTYDIEFWGPDGMCSSFYLGALQAAVLMGRALNEETPLYATLLARGKARVESDLFNGEYFIQRVQWKGLRAGSPMDFKSTAGDYSPEAAAVFEKEGPKYQYGSGCLSDGVLGAWMEMVCGVGQTLDAAKITSHLRSVYKYNFKHNLSNWANTARPSFAWGNEGGLILCTWPKGGEPSLPMPYSHEVWTGFEYQAASHMMRMGMVREGLEIVRVCRARYDGRVRNPFDEFECGHWYARAMSSYALLFGLSGARYDAVEKVLFLEPRLQGDFRCFLSTATGYGTVGVKHGKPFYEPKSGTVDIREIRYQRAG